MRMTLVAALLAMQLGCGGSGSAPLSESSALTQSDAGTPGEDGGTSAEDAGTSAADAGSSTGTCDCSGMALPDVCMVCSNGMSECAHFVCASSVCEVELCQ